MVNFSYLSYLSQWFLFTEHVVHLKLLSFGAFFLLLSGWLLESFVDFLVFWKNTKDLWLKGRLNQKPRVAQVPEKENLP